MLMAPPADVVFQHMRDEEPPGDLVTVAVSLYNYAQFLPECLDSVLAQRHAAIELIVVDDVSTADDSLAVASAWLQEHAQRFSSVLLLRHRRNQGLARARNTAFAHARASHVLGEGKDDVALASYWPAAGAGLIVSGLAGWTEVPSETSAGRWTGSSSDHTCSGSSPRIRSATASCRATLPT